MPTMVRASTAALADICICISLTWELHRRKTGFTHTDSMTRTLRMYILNRGVLTTVVQIGLLGAYLGSLNQDTMVWTVFHCVGCKSTSSQSLGRHQRHLMALTSQSMSTP
ncbi:uncharacterized protein B0H18DRAFT_647917 [Fomitopsis serialis]|uniref:uncharacterized protein n=1 Tax=Fomitopsis serialis TaxID=139415 RepID=UPI002008DC14|nr:uncharacterized protein B0H18DRAFT_647917 [Neoantrodia serialis]KAH9933506.1 hypothetical protein B0H18DRAFT_647917 [Neoantrodia serialis]